MARPVPTTRAPARRLNPSSAPSRVARDRWLRTHRTGRGATPVPATRTRGGAT